MAIYSGNLITFTDEVLIKNVSAGPVPPKYFRTVYELVPTVSKTFDCVWADGNSSQTKGKVYFSTSTGVYIIDLAGKFLYQYITPIDNNVTGEVLIDVGVVDLNVSD